MLAFALDMRGGPQDLRDALEGGRNNPTPCLPARLLACLLSPKPAWHFALPVKAWPMHRSSAPGTQAVLHCRST